MIIKPSDKSVKTLLEGDFFKIPRFQRPYSWDQENVDDFWSDAIASDATEYFIGSFVLYRESSSSDVFMVVDGQQRLTTATILLAVIRNAFDDLEAKALAKGTQSLIERTDVNNEKRYVLLTETSYPFLQEHIQKHGAPQLQKNAGAEEESIEAAFRYLTKQVDTVLAAIDGDRKLSVKKKSSEKQKRLLAIRDNVLRLQLITVELQNQDDAYLIFETLNTRGKDLGIADLVKNLLTRLLKPKNKGVDVARDKWHSILDLFDASSQDIDVNSFIYHSWISRYPYTGKERLFREIKERVPKVGAEAYLDRLVLDSQLYRKILEPDSEKWTNQEAELCGSLRALALFRVGQPLPMIMAILRAYRGGNIKLAKAKEVLRSMENFHVQFTALTAQRTGGGTAKMYAAAAQELTEASTPQLRANAVKIFRSKLVDRVPTYEEFEAGVLQLEFLSTSTKQKGLVQYLLRRIDEHKRKGPPVDYAKMSIEHIAPENPKSGNPLATAGRLGNLLLLDKHTNNKLANKSFTEKVALLKAEKIRLDSSITAASIWNETEIEARTKALAKLAYDEIFRV